MKQTNITQSIRTGIFKSILSGAYQPGSKFPTEREMAEQTGSCRVTIRRVYEQLQAAGILERQQGRGTFVAQHFGGNPAAGGHIALLTSVDTRFSINFIQEFEKAVSQAGLLLILRLTHESPEKEEDAAINLVSLGVRNLVIWPSGHAFPETTFARLRILGVNMVFFDRMRPGSYADYVGLNNEDALRQLFDYAHRQGLKHPVFVAHTDVQADSDTLRQDAFFAHCARYGVEGRVVAVSRTHPVTKLPPGIANDSAIFCVNDPMALSLRPFVKSPQQLFGIDGLTDAFVSYAQPLAKMARTTVDLLLRQQRLAATWKPVSRLFCGNLVNEGIRTL